MVRFKQVLHEVAKHYQQIRGIAANSGNSEYPFPVFVEKSISS